MSEKNRNMNWAEEVGGRELEGMWLEQVCDGWVALEEAQEWKEEELQHSSFSLESRDRGCGDHMLWSQWDVRTPCSHKWRGLQKSAVSSLVAGIAAGWPWNHPGQRSCGAGWDIGRKGPAVLTVCLLVIRKPTPKFWCVSPLSINFTSWELGLTLIFFFPLLLCLPGYLQNNNLVEGLHYLVFANMVLFANCGTC